MTKSLAQQKITLLPNIEKQVTINTGRVYIRSLTSGAKVKVNLSDSLLSLSEQSDLFSTLELELDDGSEFGEIQFTNIGNENVQIIIDKASSNLRVKRSEFNDSIQTEETNQTILDGAEKLANNDVDNPLVVRVLDPSEIVEEEEYFEQSPFIWLSGEKIVEILPDDPNRVSATIQSGIGLLLVYGDVMPNLKTQFIEAGGVIRWEDGAETYLSDNPSVKDGVDFITDYKGKISAYTGFKVKDNGSNPNFSDDPRPSEYDAFTFDESDIVDRNEGGVRVLVKSVGTAPQMPVIDNE